MCIRCHHVLSINDLLFDCFCIKSLIELTVFHRFHLIKIKLFNQKLRKRKYEKVIIHLYHSIASIVDFSMCVNVNIKNNRINIEKMRPPSLPHPYVFQSRSSQCTHMEIPMYTFSNTK